jgi:hypothetical protein
LALTHIPIASLGFELDRADTEFLTPVAHQHAQFPDAHVRDFVHANQHGCANRQAAMSNLANHGRLHLKGA